ncbi:MAG: hypothetical protein METHAR1v1_50014 [Methanothrix sp.]|nr:MAG: hypothetical protein METHAR1v1_50014 [Methanothrix sp.]
MGKSYGRSAGEPLRNITNNFCRSWIILINEAGGYIGEMKPLRGAGDRWKMLEVERSGGARVGELEAEPEGRPSVH